LPPHCKKVNVNPARRNELAQIYKATRRCRRVILFLASPSAPASPSACASVRAKVIRCRARARAKRIII